MAFKFACIKNLTIVGVPSMPFGGSSTSREKYPDLSCSHGSQCSTRMALNAAINGEYSEKQPRSIIYQAVLEMRGHNWTVGGWVVTPCVGERTMS